MKKYILAGAIAIAVIIIFFLLLFQKHEIYIFPGLEGPDTITKITDEQPATAALYGEGGLNAMAILLTDTKSAWLGLAHGLKSAGIPFIVTEDYKAALSHKVVLVYPEISGAKLQPQALQALAAHPRGGGTLIGINVIGGGMEEFFGFSGVVPSRERFEIKFSAEEYEKNLPDENERVISLGNRNKSKTAIGTYGYTNAANAVASYEDGMAAITARKVGEGYAYAAGIDPGDYMMRGYNNRAEWMARTYVNEYGTGMDVLLRWIRYVYVAGEPQAAILGIVPFNKELAVMISHDVDYVDSLRNAVIYAEYEKSKGIRATYFIQAKYTRDWNEDIFLNDKNAHYLKDLADMGMELGSHSVSHSRVFYKFPAGTGEERYPQYSPFVEGKESATGGSVLGELRISKFLIEKLSGKEVLSFRPGHLANPQSLPQTLSASGYLYSSSVTANTSLTHLPFRLNYGHDIYSETGIFEFPVTIEDEHPPALLKRLPQAVLLSKKIAANGGIFVVLIHTDKTGDKLEFEKQFMEAVKDYSWIGSISDFGAWWQARDRTVLSVAGRGRGYIVSLKCPSEIEGLSVHVPSGWEYTGSPSSSHVLFSEQGVIVLGKVKGDVLLQFKRL